MTRKFTNIRTLLKCYTYKLWICWLRANLILINDSWSVKTKTLLIHLSILNKVAFLLSGNPLCFNMGSQWCLYIFRRLQCSLTLHVLHADMLAMFNNEVSGTKTWLAHASVGCMYAMPSVMECEYHAYVVTGGATWVQLNQKLYH